MSSVRRTGAGALVVLSMVVAACGGDDGDAAGQVDEGVKSEVQNQLNATASTASATTAPAKDPTSMDGWFALWAQERAAVVKKIKDGKFGLSPDGKTLTGPGDFTLDLSKCPSGWSNTEGLADTE